VLFRSPSGIVAGNGFYGGGGGGYVSTGKGAVRIMWGAGRSFPTNAA
jgi:hypothetical protein